LGIEDVVREKLSSDSLLGDIFYDCLEGIETIVVRSTGPGCSLAPQTRQIKQEIIKSLQFLKGRKFLFYCLFIYIHIYMYMHLKKSFSITEAQERFKTFKRC